MLGNMLTKKPEKAKPQLVTGAPSDVLEASDGSNSTRLHFKSKLKEFFYRAL
jgi:hypothetical protein